MTQSGNGLVLGLHSYLSEYLELPLHVPGVVSVCDYSIAFEKVVCRVIMRHTSAYMCVMLFPTVH